MAGSFFNKLSMAVLMAMLIAMLAAFVSKKLVHPHQLAENAYKVEGVEERMVFKLPRSLEAA